MTLLFMVYDSAGEPFEVRPDHAKRLVIEHGWSMEPPLVKTTVVPLPKKRLPAAIVEVSPEVELPIAKPETIDITSASSL